MNYPLDTKKEIVVGAYAYLYSLIKYNKILIDARLSYWGKGVLGGNCQWHAIPTLGIL